MPPTSDARARDADLTRLLARGELEAAFDALVARYADKVYGLCRTLLRDEAAAEDATQDTLLRVWRGLGGYREERAALSTWIYTVARNCCLSLLQAPDPALLSTTEPAVQAAVEQRPTSAQVSDADGAALLRRLVDALPDAQRQCTLLYYYDERSVAEAALQLGLPEGTVKTHLHRARAALRQALRDAGLDDPQHWW